MPDTFHHKSAPPEGGWGWMVVLGVHVIQILTAGEAACLGIILVEWVEEFEASVTATSWAVGLVPMLAGFLSPITNVLADRYGHRLVCCIGAALSSVASLLSSYAQSLLHLYILFGGLMGVGLGFLYAPSIMVVGVYFKERFTLANSLALAGICIGQMVFPPLFTQLIAQYGWRGALLLMAAINMNMFAFACLFRPLPKASNKHKHQPNEQNLDASKEFAPLQEDALELHDVDADFHKDDDDMSHTKISRSRLGNCCASTSKVSGIPELCLTPYYPISMFTALIVGIVIYCVNLYIVPRALDHTYSKYQGAVLLTLIGIGSLIGRLVSGLLIDLKYASSQVVYMVSLASAAVELLLTPLLNTFAFLALFSALFGISIGISSSLVYVIAREVAPSWLLAPALGFTVLLVAGGNAFGTVIGGWLYDVTADYGNIFYACGGLMALAAILFIPTMCWLNRMKKRDITMT